MTKQELLNLLTTTPCKDGLAEFNAWEGDAFSYFEEHERGEEAAEWCAEHGAIKNRAFFEWIVRENAELVLEIEPESPFWTQELFRVAVGKYPYLSRIYAPRNQHWTPELWEWAKRQVRTLSHL